MNKAKKTNKRESMPNQRKIPINTLPSSNLIEQLRIPTTTSDMKSMGRSLELRNMPKSMQMRKSTIPCMKKKSNLRKGSGKTAKSINSGSQALRTITQTFKQLKQIKLSHEKYHSKSKSPKFKSKSASKLFPKKKQSKINPNFNSERLLGLNLQHTIKQINMKEMTQEDDSYLIESHSSKRQPEIYYNITSENDDSINLIEVKNYCSSLNTKEFNQTITVNINFFRQNRAATKIQKAWRNYQTRMLIRRYSSLIVKVELSEHSFASNSQTIKNEDKQEPQDSSREVVVSFENQHPQKMLEKSRTDEEKKLEVSMNAEQLVEQFKKEELERWDSIINIISHYKNCTPTEMAILLQKLTEQSENNKKNLESITFYQSNQKYKKENNKTQELQPPIQRHQKGKFEYSSSDRSIENNQYDNKKYIQFLDSDVFPNQFSVESPRVAKHHKISKAQQQLLLENLKGEGMVDFGLNRAKSLKEIEIKTGEEPVLKIKHRRSTSEKSSKENKQIQYKIDFKRQNIDVDKLIQNFLEGQYSEQKDARAPLSEDRLQQKIAELTKMKLQYQQENDREKQGKLLINKEYQKQEVPIIVQRSPAAFSLHRDQFIKMEVQQSNDENFFESSDDLQPNSEDEAKNIKFQTCATIILDKMIFQTLKDIAKSDIICEAFKAFSRSRKEKQKKSIVEPVRKKKGFITGKAQVQSFLNNLLIFLQREEPNIFKNLEVPTGPSALEMLRFMHQQSNDDDSCAEDDEDEVAIMVIPNRVFDAFWLMKEKSILIEIPQTIDQTTPIFRQQLELLKSLNKIFYRSLFDTFNECLDCERNFGQYGRPFPWKKSPAFNHHKSPSMLQNHIVNAKKSMMDLCTIYCGLIVQPQDIPNFDQDYIKQIHEERLSRMLAGDFLQLESRWTFYDDEETEILVEVAQTIYTDLMAQIQNDLSISL